MPRAALSTSNGPNDPCAGCGADVLPAMSLTVTAGMVTLFVSVFAGTFVCTEKDEGPTRPEPEPLSLAVQGTTASVACHVTAGGVHETVGAVKSVLMVKLGVEELTLFPLFVTSVSTMFALSVAAYVITVVPSVVTGIVTDPFAPLNVPEAGLGKLAPLAW